MKNIFPVTKDRHQKKYWNKPSSYLFTAQTQLAPLVAQELRKAAQAMPLAFIPGPNGFIIIGILSPEPGVNFFINDKGQWLGNYVPACFRSYPFKVARLRDEDNLALCVMEDSGLVSDTAGESFFDEQGNLAAPLTKIFDFLYQIEQSRTTTDLAVSALQKTGVIVPWPLSMNEKPIDGLYTIDEAKLSSLDDQHFLELRKAKALPVAYAQLLSQANLWHFTKLAELRMQTASQKIEKEFENILFDDDTFKF